MLKFDRQWRWFAPAFTYAVRLDGVWLGEVARMDDGSCWFASNKSWEDGQDFPETFRTRREAAEHLWQNRTEQMGLLLGLAS